MKTKFDKLLLHTTSVCIWELVDQLTVPEVKNCTTPGKPYLLKYCMECNEIWFCNVFFGVLPCLRFSCWSNELFTQLLKVAFSANLITPLDSARNFLEFEKKSNFLRPTVEFTANWIFFQNFSYFSKENIIKNVQT